jgi:hypothetical protein
VLAVRRFLAVVLAHVLVEKLQIGALFILLIVLAMTNLFGQNILRDRQPDGSILERRTSSIYRQMCLGLKNVHKEVEHFHYEITQFFVAEYTPSDSLIATTTVTPLLLDRPFYTRCRLPRTTLTWRARRKNSRRFARGVKYLHTGVYEL